MLLAPFNHHRRLFHFCNRAIPLQLAATLLLLMTMTDSLPADNNLDAVVETLRTHEFHPIQDGFTYDRHLETHGVADMDDADGTVRVRAIHEMVGAGAKDQTTLIELLSDENPRVRDVAAAALGILRADKAVSQLARVLAEDPDEVVRSQAAISLGEIGDAGASDALRLAKEEDASRDVRHQAVLALYAVEEEIPPDPRHAEAWRNLDLDTFQTLEPGQPAPDFTLTDTDGNSWTLSEHLGNGPVVLVWIFADWCPVCHHEFHDLIELREEFEEAGVTVATLQAHDLYRCRVMTGQEIQPDYKFRKRSSHEDYLAKRWWPHLSDPAAAVGGMYGIWPMAFTVHAEWINRPATFVIDEEGIVRMAYVGTFWGDRPSIPDVLEMIRSGDYDFNHPRRLQAGER